MAFVKAQRQRVFVKVAVTGPSGAGKTFSALKLAFGMGKKVAFIDTENRSGSLYSHLGEYDVQEIEAPFTVAKYVQAINEAAAAGYDVLVIDSLTHAWAGDGGLLAKKEALDARGGNQYTNWATITKEHEAFKASILQAPIHIIGTMRSKQEYVLQDDGRGKQKPVKVGMQAIQRDGLDYEFTTVFDIAQDHSAIASKDRTGIFDGLTEKLSEKHGKQILEWLSGGAPATAPGFSPPVQAPAPARPAATPAPSPQQAAPAGPKADPITPAQVRMIGALADQLGETIGTNGLTRAQASRLVEELKARLYPATPTAPIITADPPAGPRTFSEYSKAIGEGLKWLNKDWDNTTVSALLRANASGKDDIPGLQRLLDAVKAEDPRLTIIPALNSMPVFKDAA